MSAKLGYFAEKGQFIAAPVKRKLNDIPARRNAPSAETKVEVLVAIDGLVVVSDKRRSHIHPCRLIAQLSCHFPHMSFSLLPTLSSSHALFSFPSSVSPHFTVLVFCNIAFRFFAHSKVLLRLTEQEPLEQTLLKMVERQISALRVTSQIFLQPR
jgi:hypothetical protein